jgi:hypothetical protein
MRATRQRPREPTETPTREARELGFTVATGQTLIVTGASGTGEDHPAHFAELALNSSWNSYS